MKLTLAKRSEEDKLKKFWSDSFGQEKAFIDAFFEARREMNHCYIAKDDNGDIISMLNCLQIGYTREMHTTPTSYIVGATTREDHRREGLMTRLIDIAHTEEHQILTTSAGMEPYFLHHGFYTAGQVAIYRLHGNPLGEIEESTEELATIYANVTDKTGSLDRDDFAWQIVREGSKAIVANVDGERAYALVAGPVAFETMCEGVKSARELKRKMEKAAINQVWMPSQSPLASLFSSTPALIPLGESNEESICAGLYIAQQL